MDGPPPDSPEVEANERKHMIDIESRYERRSQDGRNTNNNNNDPNSPVMVPLEDFTVSPSQQYFFDPNDLPVERVNLHTTPHFFKGVKQTKMVMDNSTG